MRAIKRINNNIALCISKNGREFLARGKGIGFHEFPYELDVKDVERTYYDVDEVYVSMISDIPDELFEISGKIVDYARNTVDSALSSNLVFTLADHINFSLQRYRENLLVSLPIAYDIEHLFDKEYNVGLYGIRILREDLGLYLPRDEAPYIAMHIINARKKQGEPNNSDEKIMEDITGIIEGFYSSKIDRSSFNYSRFISHMNYLLKRGKSDSLLKSENSELYDVTIKTYPKDYRCSLLVVDYLNKALNTTLSKEELFYILLHVHRLCTREDFTA